MLAQCYFVFQFREPKEDSNEVFVGSRRWATRGCCSLVVPFSNDGRGATVIIGAVRMQTRDPAPVYIKDFYMFICIYPDLMMRNRVSFLFFFNL